MKPVLFLGSVTVDITLNVPHLPSLEEDISLSHAFMSLGGCAANAARILAYENLPFDLGCITGNGMYGSWIRNELSRYGLKPQFERQEENGFCLCLVTPDGNRTFLAVHGCEYRYTSADLEAINPGRYSMVYINGIDLEEEANMCVIAWLEENHIPVFFAPGPAAGVLPVERLRRMLALKPVLHLSKEEGMTLLNCYGMRAEGMDDLCRKLFDLAGNTVIVTDGADGAWAINGALIHEPAVPVQAVDGTGAGDSHAGTVLAGLLEEKPLETILHNAGIIGAAAVATEGSGVSLEMYSNIKEELE